MRQRQLMAAAGACGVLCAACVLAYMSSVQGEANAARAEALARYGGEQVEVCVATRDIAAGERIDAGAIETKLWVADLLPEGVLTSQSDAIGKTVTSTVLKGEAISSKRFERDRDGLDVPEGKVAVSVPSKAVLAVGGAVRAGMRVDVYASGDAATAAIVRDALVLDTSLGTSSGLISEASWVVLAVEPEKVQEIVAASSRTELCFALPGEGVVAQDQGASKSSASSASASSKAAAKQEAE